MQKTIGGDRLGAGNNMKVELHNYHRSTHDLGYILKTTMSAGTLVPFLNKIALPGDTWDVHLDAYANTHPTLGPLFGSFKLQLDIFITPLRIYNARTHNNEINIGRDMSQIKIPQIVLTAHDTEDADDFNNSQVNPSCVLAYLGIRGIGKTTTDQDRSFNAIPIINYWEIYKNYYSNKQEEIGAVIHVNTQALITTITAITVDGNTLPFAPGTDAIVATIGSRIVIAYTGATPLPNQVSIAITPGGRATADQLFVNFIDTGTALEGDFDYATWGDLTLIRWNYVSIDVPIAGQPRVVTFPLSNIDTMRRKILQHDNTVFETNSYTEPPYEYLVEEPQGIPNILSSQEGLGLKTYQSDQFNNWIKTDWIDGAGGVNELTAIDVSSGTLQLDQLILARKIFDLLNRIAISGGTYDDWQDAMWAHERMKRTESPAYIGGLSKEIIFQEVVSNSATDSNGNQPLGTLGGKGTLAKKHKGGHVVIRVDEPSIVMGIVSITPRIDQSQGNDWTVNLKDFNNLFTPALNQIGFQELIQEQMAWSTTEWNGTEWVQQSAGKQPAWINYMTDVNRVYGNFAIKNNEMFMVLNRQYEVDPTTGDIDDLTTYIDPVKYNQIFAQTALDAQNFWMQIAVDITARRKMSAKAMPNL